MTREENERLGDALNQIYAELHRGCSNFESFNSAHEGYAVIKEELDELWEEVKKNDLGRSREEAVQLAAMAIRFLVDVYD